MPTTKKKKKSSRQLLLLSWRCANCRKLVSAFVRTKGDRGRACLRLFPRHNCAAAAPAEASTGGK